MARPMATVQLAGASQLASGNGDIVVFLPRNLAANIDALVSKGGEHRIEADPALHLSYSGGASEWRGRGTCHGSFERRRHSVETADHQREKSGCNIWIRTRRCANRVSVNNKSGCES